MQLGVMLRPSRTKNEHDPGHMGVYWIVGIEEIEFRGFRFRITDLPDEYQAPSRWRDYLFENRVPGYIVDDVILRDDYKYRTDTLLDRQWDLEDRRESFVKQLTEPRPYDYYSFNPDSNECHNCVTWSIETINNVIASDVLPRVREGRIKLMMSVLEEE